jgi:hypothetical protein
MSNNYNTILQSNNTDLQAILNTINELPEAGNGTNTSDATATSNDILSDKTAYVNGEKITGTMPNNNEINYSIDGINTQSVDIPTGYTSGGKVSLTDDIENMLAAI